MTERNDSAADWLDEVQDIECIAENFRLGLTGFGHEDDYAALPDRIEAALAFRVGGNERCVTAKAALRKIAEAFGFNLSTEEGYFGAPIPRRPVTDDTVREQLPPLQPYAVHLATEREQRANPEVQS